MKRVLSLYAAALFALAIVNAGYQLYNVDHMFHDYFGGEDSTSHADRVFEPIRKALSERKITRLGYRVEGNRDGDFFTVQYTIAPVVLRSHTTADHWFLMNYAKSPPVSPEYLCVKDFGYNLALYETIPNSNGSPTIDLGKVWHETEGLWKGTWTRRGSTSTFDAEWKGPNGQTVKDEVTFVSSACQEIVLYREGVKGHYFGELSDDGTTVKNGRGEWFSSKDTWNATINR